MDEIKLVKFKNNLKYINNNLVNDRDDKSIEVFLKTGKKYLKKDIEFYETKVINEYLIINSLKVKIVTELTNSGKTIDLSEKLDSHDFIITVLKSNNIIIYNKKNMLIKIIDLSTGDIKNKINSIYKMINFYSFDEIYLYEKECVIKYKLNKNKELLQNNIKLNINCKYENIIDVIKLYSYLLVLTKNNIYILNTVKKIKIISYIKGKNVNKNNIKFCNGILMILVMNKLYFYDKNSLKEFYYTFKEISRDDLYFIAKDKLYINCFETHIDNTISVDKEIFNINKYDPNEFSDSEVSEKSYFTNTGKIYSENSFINKSNDKIDSKLDNSKNNSYENLKLDKFISFNPKDLNNNIESKSNKIEKNEKNKINNFNELLDNFNKFTDIIFNKKFKKPDKFSTIENRLNKIITKIDVIKSYNIINNSINTNNLLLINRLKEKIYCVDYNEDMKNLINLTEEFDHNYEFIIKYKHKINCYFEIFEKFKIYFDKYKSINNKFNDPNLIIDDIGSISSNISSIENIYKTNTNTIIIPKLEYFIENNINDELLKNIKLDNENEFLLNINNDNDIDNKVIEITIN